MALDAFLAGERTVFDVYGPGGIGKSVLILLWEERARAAGVVVAARDLAGGVSPAVLLHDLRDAIATYEGIGVDAFRDFDQALREHALVEGVLATYGGSGALFDVLGRVKDPLGIASFVAGAGQATAERIRQRTANRAALDRYWRGVDRTLAETFLDGLGQVAHADRLVVLLLDTYENAGPLDDWLVTHVVPRLPTGARLVIAGRDALPQMNFQWYELTDTVDSRPLDELPLEEARRYLRHYGLTDPASVERVVALTGGYPLLLMLACHLGTSAGGWAALGELTARDGDELATKLLDTILRHERARAVRQVLERGCVAPWLDPGVIGVVLDVNLAEARTLYEQLATHSFCERHPRGLRLHDKIRELLRARLEFTDPDGYAEVTQRLESYLDDRDRASNRPAR